MAARLDDQLHWENKENADSRNLRSRVSSVSCGLSLTTVATGLALFAAYLSAAAWLTHFGSFPSFFENAKARSDEDSCEEPNLRTASLLRTFAS